MQRPQKLFARPWHIIENTESFAIEDDGGAPLAYVYFEDEPVRARSMKRMGKDEARRLATQIMRLPELLEELKRHRAARNGASVEL